MPLGFKHLGFPDAEAPHPPANQVWHLSCLLITCMQLHEPSAADFEPKGWGNRSSTPVQSTDSCSLGGLEHDLMFSNRLWTEKKKNLFVKKIKIDTAKSLRKRIERKNITTETETLCSSRFKCPFLPRMGMSDLKSLEI